MRLAQPSVDLCAPSTSSSNSLVTHVRNGQRSRRPRLNVRAAQDGHTGANAKGTFSGVLGGISKQRPQAIAAPVREEAPSTSQNVQSSSVAAATAPTGLPSRLQSWLPWSSQAKSIPLASQLQAGADASQDDAALLADGMAATAMTSQETTSSRRGWSVLPFRSSSSPGNTSIPVPGIEHRPVQVDHAALQLLRQRAISKSRPGERLDNFKLGLVVEGGGMRGCVSGGSLQALHNLGLRDAFDAVYGSSAGAINGSFFLANQLDAVAIYHDHIASEQFINLRRLLSRKPDLPPALNLEFLLNHVMQSVHPLDFDTVLKSPIPLKVVASSLDALSPVLLSDFKDKDDLVTALRASATVPEVAGGPVYHRGHRLVDAAVFEAVPFRSAIADGCTHVLVLCTRPAPARKSLIDQALADAVEAAVKRAVLSPDYMVPAWKAEVEILMKDGLSQDEMLLRSFDEDAEQLPWFAGSHVFPIYPASRCPSPVCTDVAQLKAGVAEGRRSTMTVMKAILGDVLDFSSYMQETSQIVPIKRNSSSTGAERLLGRMEAELAQHA